MKTNGKEHILSECKQLSVVKKSIENVLNHSDEKLLFKNIEWLSSLKASKNGTDIEISIDRKDDEYFWELFTNTSEGKIVGCQGSVEIIRDSEIGELKKVDVEDYTELIEKHSCKSSEKILMNPKGEKTSVLFVVLSDNTFNESNYLTKCKNLILDFFNKTDKNFDYLKAESVLFYRSIKDVRYIVLTYDEACINRFYSLEIYDYDKKCLNEIHNLEISKERSCDNTNCDVDDDILLNKLKEIVSDITKIPVEEISETQVFENLGFDSIGISEFT